MDHGWKLITRTSNEGVSAVADIWQYLTREQRHRLLMVELEQTRKRVAVLEAAVTQSCGELYPDAPLQKETKV